VKGERGEGRGERLEGRGERLEGRGEEKNKNAVKFGHVKKKQYLCRLFCVKS
jgi:hypothetical protein